MTENYDYSEGYWKSCLFRYKRRKEFTVFEKNIDDNINIKRYKDDIVIVYYIFNGEELIGSLSGTEHENKFYISLSIINSKYRRIGIGSKLYKYVLEKYKCLVSDIDRSPSAEAMWKSLSRHYGPIINDNLRYMLKID